MEYITEYSCALGNLLMLSEGGRLTGLTFVGETDEVQMTSRVEEPKLPVFEETRSWLDIYFGGGIPGFVPPIALIGTDFQKEVWEHIREIPYGETVTYGEIAEKIAKRRGLSRMSAQAVGVAVGRNPVGIIVPCHRVMGQGGNLTGYGGGIWRKVWLLKLEHAYQNNFYIPEKGTKL